MLKQSKSITVTLSLVLFIFSIVVYTSCKKDPYTYIDTCAGIVCQNNGTCVSGKCSCTAGYTGENCEKKANAAYLGKWNVTQQIIASNNQSSIGTTKNYEITISEDATGVTMVSFAGFMGEPSYTASVRIGMTIGYVDVDSNTKTEVDVPATASNFVFKRYQPLGASTIQLVKGQGTINALGTQMSGEFYLIYPDSTKAIEDRVSFSASYIN